MKCFTACSSVFRTEALSKPCFRLAAQLFLGYMRLSCSALLLLCWKASAGNYEKIMSLPIAVTVQSPLG